MNEPKLMSRTNMSRKIVVIGASRGGIAALKRLLPALPADFPAPVLVVMHIGDHESKLPQLLSALCVLPVRHAADGELISPGAILMAPPDRHLLIDDKTIRLKQGPKENHARPAIDPLFRSAAIGFRKNTIGVLLTGDLDDGTIGALAIKSYGGQMIVQDPLEAEAPSMPGSALEYAEIDYCTPIDEIARLLIMLVTQSPSDDEEDEGAQSGDTAWVDIENRLLASSDMDATDVLDQIGTRSALVCPECHGAMWDMKMKPPRFRCHTGHAYSALTLLKLQTDEIEESIWAAIRALKDKEAMLRRLIQNAHEQQRLTAVAEYEQSCEQIRAHSERLKSLVAQ
jgi:two-component system, chemotaxis family, protein-glutamate methylesterase/glutaminase